MYKYCTFDKYSLENLKRKQLWCNHYEAFNDPFECWCVVNTGIPHPEEDEERFFNVIRLWGFSPCEKDIALQNYDFYLEHFVEDQINVDYHIQSARICCFSKKVDNLLMWAHYADGLRGFCIEFDFDCFKNEVDIIPVNYSTSPPVLESIAYPLANDIFWHSEEEHSREADNYMRDFYSKMLASKPTAWKYEEEYRLILHTKSKSRAGEPFEYPKKAIKRIIIGEKASDTNIDCINNIMSFLDLDVPIKTATRSQDKYEVQVH